MRGVKGGAMKESKLQLAEFGYLYYSLYSYRRKVEADIKNIIKTDTEINKVADLSEVDSSKQLYLLTQKLRTISLITSKVIMLNKGYKRA